VSLPGKCINRTMLEKADFIDIKQIKYSSQCNPMTCFALSQASSDVDATVTPDVTSVRFRVKPAQCYWTLPSAPGLLTAEGIPG